MGLHTNMKKKNSKETSKKSNLKIKDFWWFHNDECWRIKREGRVDFYLFTRTMRYIYKPSSTNKKWRGTKNPFLLAFTTEEVREKELSKVKVFDSEDEAVRWLSGENIMVNKKDIS